jgi:hypothetical protein
MRTTVVLRALLLAVACASTTAAKEPTRKLIISGGGLAGLVEITDSTTLALSNVFTGNFLDTSSAVGAEPRDLPEYELSFYLSDLRGSALGRLFTHPRLYRAYVVRLVVDSATHAAYVFIPGNDDPWGRWNHGVIIRQNQEGRWIAASPAWSARVAHALANARRLPKPSCERLANPAYPLPVFTAGDSLYPSIAQLTHVLEANGLHVLCAYHDTFDGFLGRRSAGVMTDHGGFAAVFFSTPADAHAVSVSGTVRNGDIVTEVRAPHSPRPVESLSGAEPGSVVIRGPWLLISFGQSDLTRSLRSLPDHS